MHVCAYKPTYFYANTLFTKNRCDLVECTMAHRFTPSYLANPLVDICQGFLGQTLHTPHLWQREKLKKRQQRLFCASSSWAAATPWFKAQLRGGKARDRLLQTSYSIQSLLASPQKRVHLQAGLIWDWSFDPLQRKNHWSARSCEKKRMRRAGWKTRLSLPKFPTIYHGISKKHYLSWIKCSKTRPTCLKPKVRFEVVWIYTRAWFSGERQVTGIIPRLGLQTGPS